MATGPTITAKFIADTSKMTSEVDKATSDAGTKMSSFAKNAAIALGGAFVVDKVVDFGKKSVEAAAADAEAQAKLAQALKSTTGATDAQVAGAESFISKLSQSAAIADDDLRPALATLARGFGDTQKAQEALSIATDISAGTGKDLNTVSEAMMKAAQGNTGALGKLGIATKDASGKALTLDQIMANAADTFKGQASTAAESTAGQMRSAEIAMGELQETVGSALLPVIGTLATFLTGTLLPALSTSFGWIMDNKGVVIAALIGVGAVLLPLFISWAAGAAAAAVATIAAAAPFIAIAAVIAGVAYLIINNWDTIVAATEAAWDAITAAVRFVWDWITNNWPLLLTIITGPIGAAVAIVVNNWDTIKNAVMTAFNWVRDNWPLLLAIITGPIGTAVLIVQRNWDSIKGAAEAVWNWLNGTWQSLSGLISAPFSTAASAVSGFFGTIKDAALGAYNWVKDKFDAMASAIDNVIGGIRNAVSSIVNAIKSPINGVINAWNRIGFTIPSFTLPSFDMGPVHIGGQTFGGATIDFPNIPTLAGGGVLTSPTLFIGGEAGTEIVAPEDMLRAIVAEEGGGHYVLNIYPRTADAGDIAYGFRRLELMAGVT
jgi:hypothetical protein